MKKGFTLIELLIVVAIIAILAAIAVPNFLEAQVRSKVSRVRADHRTVATGVEIYYLDNNQYPTFFGGTAPPAALVSAFEVVLENPSPAYDAIDECRTFALPQPGVFNSINTITSPISYVSSYPADPFADSRGLPPLYFANASRFIIGSWGPDADQNGARDLDWCGFTFNPLDGSSLPLPGSGAQIETIFNPGQSNSDLNTLTLLLVGQNSAGRAWTYDSSNGTISQGDVWRIKD